LLGSEIPADNLGLTGREGNTSVDRANQAASAAPPEAVPAVLKQMTARGLVVAMMVAAFAGAIVPYVVLKLGFGPNGSVMSALIAYALLSAIGLFAGGRGTRYELNLAQAAGVGAGQIAFMCVVLAAFDLLAAKGLAQRLGPLEIFLWLSISGGLGVLLAAPLRGHYIDHENLPFAGGSSAAETILVLDSDGGQAGNKARALGVGMVLAAALHWIRNVGVAGWTMPGSLMFGSYSSVNLGLGYNLLSFGSGMLFGLRIVLSMAAGVVLAAVVLPPLLVSWGFIAKATGSEVNRWVMWPATGMMVAGGFTSLVISWRSIANAFRNLGKQERGAGTPQDDNLSARTMLIGAAVLVLALCAVQQVFLGFPVWLTLLAVLTSVPLLLAGTRVLGETNWGPISAMAHVCQAVFAAVVPGNVPVNMVASCVAGNVPGTGEAVMQNYRAAQVVGGRPRDVTIVHLLSVVVGALMLALVYPALRERFGFGPDGLSMPISVKWASFGELLARGVAALPPGSIWGLIIGSFAGTVLTLLELKLKDRSPSATAMGMAMLMPGTVVVTMVAGGLLQALWEAKGRASEAAYRIPLASGFIAGDAIMAVIILILARLGIVAG
jgi:uncharacterized oligopeptide transporter (OPT) family protein